MRLARVRDYIRWLSEKPGEWPLQVERIAYEDIPALGTGEIVLSSPLSVLAGPNGVGKTTLLKATWAASQPADVKLDGSAAIKLSAGTVSVDFRLGDERKTTTSSFASGAINGGDGLGVEVLHLDAGDSVRAQQHEFCSFDDIEDLINGLGVRTATEVELVEINYITRRDYREVKIYEVESSSGIIPFFEVSYGNDRYDSRTIGAGELSALYLWWAIGRAEAGTFVLLEEPETYLSPASQEAMCHYLMAQAYEAKLTVLVTSHSASFIGKIPSSSQVFLYRAGGTIKVSEGGAPPAILETIGFKSVVDTILLVEDEAAAIFLRQILERYDPSLSRRSDIKSCNGHGGVTSKLKELKDLSNFIRVRGVYDGDMRAQDLGIVAEMAAYLPGERPIEVQFREMVSQNSESLEKATGSGDIPAILFGLEGVDHHDWYAGLCNHLGLTKAQLLPTLFRMWLEFPQNMEAAQTVLAELAEVLKK